MKMHLQTDLSCEISYKSCEEKVQISQEAEMLYYELIRALEEEETVCDTSTLSTKRYKDQLRSGRLTYLLFIGI